MFLSRHLARILFTSVISGVVFDVGIISSPTTALFVPILALSPKISPMRKEISLDVVVLPFEPVTATRSIFFDGKS